MSLSRPLDGRMESATAAALAGVRDDVLLVCRRATQLDIAASLAVLQWLLDRQYALLPPDQLDALLVDLQHSLSHHTRFANQPRPRRLQRPEHSQQSSSDPPAASVTAAPLARMADDKDDRSHPVTHPDAEDDVGYDRNVLEIVPDLQRVELLTALLGVQAVANDEQAKQLRSGIYAVLRRKGADVIDLDGYMEVAVRRLQLLGEDGALDTTDNDARSESYADLVNQYQQQQDDEAGGNQQLLILGLLLLLQQAANDSLKLDWDGLKLRLAYLGDSDNKLIPFDLHLHMAGWQPLCLAQPSTTQARAGVTSSVQPGASSGGGSGGVTDSRPSMSHRRVVHLLVHSDGSCTALRPRADQAAADGSHPSSAAHTARSSLSFAGEPYSRPVRTSQSLWALYPTLLQEMLDALGHESDRSTRLGGLHVPGPVELHLRRLWWLGTKYTVEDSGAALEQARCIVTRALMSLLEAADDPHSLSALRRRSALMSTLLVIGLIQSGKTMSMEAVLAKAMDIGFRLVIVLSGTNESLRIQTQTRLQTSFPPSDGDAQYDDDGMARFIYLTGTDCNTDLVASLRAAALDESTCYYDTWRREFIAEGKRLSRSARTLQLNEAYERLEKSRLKPKYDWMARTRNGVSGIESYLNAHPRAVLMMVIKKNCAVIKRLQHMLSGLSAECRMLWLDDESDVGGVQQPRKGNPDCDKGEGNQPCKKRDCSKCIAPVPLAFAEAMEQSRFDPQQYRQQQEREARARQEVLDADELDDQAGEAGRIRSTVRSPRHADSTLPPRSEQQAAVAEQQPPSPINGRARPVKTVAVNLVFRAWWHCEQLTRHGKKKTKTGPPSHVQLHALFVEYDRMHAQRFRVGWDELTERVEQAIDAAALDEQQRARVRDYVDKQLAAAKASRFNEADYRAELIDPHTPPASPSRPARDTASSQRSLSPFSTSSTSSMPDTGSSAASIGSSSSGGSDVHTQQVQMDVNGVVDSTHEDGDANGQSFSHGELDGEVDQAGSMDVDDECKDDDDGNDSDYSEPGITLQSSSSDDDEYDDDAESYVDSEDSEDEDDDSDAQSECSDGPAASASDIGRAFMSLAAPKDRPLDHLKLLIRYTATPAVNLTENAEYGMLPQRVWVLHPLLNNRSYMGLDYYFSRADADRQLLFPAEQRSSTFHWSQHSPLFSHHPDVLRQVASSPLQCIPYADLPNYAPVAHTAVLDKQHDLPPAKRYNQRDIREARSRMLPEQAQLDEHAGWPKDKLQPASDYMMHFLTHRLEQSRDEPPALLDGKEEPYDEQQWRSQSDDKSAPSGGGSVSDHSDGDNGPVSTAAWSERELPFSLLQACAHHAVSGGIRPWRSVQAATVLAALPLPDGSPPLTAVEQAKQAAVAVQAPLHPPSEPAQQPFIDLRQAMNAIVGCKYRDWVAEARRVESSGTPAEQRCAAALGQPFTSGILPSGPDCKPVSEHRLLRMAEVARCNVAFVAYGWLRASEGGDVGKSIMQHQPQLFQVHRVNGDYSHNTPLRFILVSRRRTAPSLSSRPATATSMDEHYHVIPEQSELHTTLTKQYDDHKLPKYVPALSEASELDHAAMFHVHRYHKVMHVLADLVEQIGYKIGLMLPVLYPHDSAGRPLNPQRTAQDMVQHSLPDSWNAYHVLRQRHASNPAVSSLKDELDAQVDMYDLYKRQFDAAHREYRRTGRWTGEWLRIKQALDCQFRRSITRMRLLDVPDHLIPRQLSDVMWYAQEQARNSVVRIFGKTKAENKAEWKYKYLYEREMTVLDYSSTPPASSTTAIAPPTRLLYHSELRKLMKAEQLPLRGVRRAPRSLLLVGSSMLSRGITVEGLTTSYFCRAMSDDPRDALLQMARFMGHNLDRKDLCTVFMQERALILYNTIHHSNRVLLHDAEWAVREDVHTDQEPIRITENIGTAHAFGRFTANKSARYTDSFRLGVTDMCCPARTQPALSANAAAMDAFLLAIQPCHTARIASSDSSSAAEQDGLREPTYVAHQLGMELYHNVPLSTVINLLDKYQPSQPADRAARRLASDLRVGRMDVQVGDSLLPPTINVAVRDVQLSSDSASALLVAEQLPSPAALTASPEGRIPLISARQADVPVAIESHTRRHVVINYGQHKSREWLFFRPTVQSSGQQQSDNSDDMHDSDSDEQESKQQREEGDHDYGELEEAKLRQLDAPLLLLITRYVPSDGSPRVSSLALLHAATRSIDRMNRTLLDGSDPSLTRIHEPRNGRKVSRRKVKARLSAAAQAVKARLPRKARHVHYTPSIQADIVRRMAALDELSGVLMPYLPPPGEGSSTRKVSDVPFNRIALVDEHGNDRVASDVLNVLLAVPTDATFGRGLSDVVSALYEPRVPHSAHLPRELHDYSVDPLTSDTRCPPSLFSIVFWLRRGGYQTVGQVWNDIRAVFQRAGEAAVQGDEDDDEDDSGNTEPWATRMSTALKRRIAAIPTVRAVLATGQGSSSRKRRRATDTTTLSTDATEQTPPSESSTEAASSPSHSLTPPAASQPHRNTSSTTSDALSSTARPTRRKLQPTTPDQRHERTD